MKKISMILFIILLLTIMPFQEALANKLISVSPKDQLFTLDNMKPGDWAIRNLAIENKSSEEINYEVAIRFDSGSKKLFNALEMQIEHDREQLAHGSLAEMKEMRFQSLPASSGETLTFRLDFPYELGNEFQGLTTGFKIEISASTGSIAVMTDRIAIDGGLTSTGKPLPNTATNLFNLMLTGLLLCCAGVIVLWWHQRRVRL